MSLNTPTLINEFVNDPAVSSDDVFFQNRKDPNLVIKKGIWLYFLLLIFEGALRRWIIPQLSSPLLLIRDPVAIWLIITAIKRNVLPSNFYMYAMVIIGFVSLYLAMFAGHGNLYVALYGVRIFVVHFPVMFVIGNVFTREDVIKMGKIILYIAIPMTALIILQFRSSPTAFVNKGVGDNLTATFGGAGDYFRPPGTFSFITGTTLFYGLVSAFVFYFLLTPGHLNKRVLTIATICLFVAVPYSISRSLFFEVAVGIVFAFATVLRKPEYFSKMIIAVVLGGIVLLILFQFSGFGTAIGAFTARFNGANETEGGLKGVLLDRYLGGIFGALFNNDKTPFWGYGLGYGSAVAGVLLTGASGRLLGEGDWGRIIGELGAFLGIIVISIRMGFSFDLTIRSIRKFAVKDLLPWMLLSFGIIIIPQGEWAQPSSLGFSTLIGGLLLASLNDRSMEMKETLASPTDEFDAE